MKAHHLCAREIAICCALALTLAGCARTAPPPTATASPIAPKQLPLIGVSLPNVDSTATTLIQKGLADNQRKSDISLVYRSADGRPEKQAEDIADLVRLKVVGLIVLPVDATLVGPPIAAARAKDIPVIAIDTPPVGTGIDALVRADTRANGRDAAKYVLDKAQERLPALIITPNDAASVDFVAGAQEALAKVPTPPQTHTIAGPEDTAAVVVPEVRDNGVRTIIAGSDALALAAMQALQGVGLLKGVNIIGYGGTRDAVLALLDGRLTADVDTRPQDLGAAADSGIAALVRKKQPATGVIVRINGADIPVIPVPGRFITRDNARDMEERWPGLMYSTPAPPTATPKPR